ncbi:putative cobalt-zinc-cadmium resistance protein CzcI [Variovorax paradoxus B4]|uniref:Cobalt-zinc-cadmium resistance protein CzcI n=2 Tax=Variovorax paradoxus TaxID=34073 RepID=A0A0H2LVR9_VARPD|nr:cation efflux protein, CzcI family [Variovorax paradoxus]AGU50756.1 putative cobalt-zinc-cadmium resistance protein CzcI [Variovorax paradoxus B4]KLN54348.1 cobalt-zinc-cadmium resistance protein CzcI precursor [Variovorax paradoxus]
MRRWLLIFLLLLLPLQSSWAASAAYCQHERDVQPQHWGHHEHEPDRSAGGSRTDDAQKSPGTQPNAVLGDCAVCHLGQAQHLPSASDRVNALPMARALRAVPAEHFISHISEVPVPPAWPLAI